MTLAVICALLLAGCVKDDCKHSYKIFSPVYKKLTELRAEVQYQGARAIENPGKIYITGDRVYLNEKGKGIHVIDNSDPRHPRNTGFINIPGNVDIALKDNILYADMHCDLAAFDVSRPGAAPVKKFLTNTFPSQSGNLSYYYRVLPTPVITNPDSIRVIVDWTSRDTVLSCEAYGRLYGCPNCNIYFDVPAQLSSTPAVATTGKAGSMSRFATAGDYLYTLDYYNMGVVGIADAANPLLVKRKALAGYAETIFPLNNNLFLGTPTGMAVYDIQTPADPAFKSMAMHWRGCDPVIADGAYAYVTIYDGAFCGGPALNELDVYDIADLTRPALVKTYALTNPHGLSKDGNLLFVCDGKDGLKIFDAADVNNLKLLKHIDGINTYDLITAKGIAYVVAKDGLYQYDYSRPAETHLLSKLGWSKPLL